MQNTQILVKKDELVAYDKVSDKIFAGGLPKVTLLFGATPCANAGAVLVHFPRGVGTAWHTHPAGQNLHRHGGRHRANRSCWRRSALPAWRQALTRSRTARRRRAHRGNL